MARGNNGFNKEDVATLQEFWTEFVDDFKEEISPEPVKTGMVTRFTKDVDELPTVTVSGQAQSFQVGFHGTAALSVKTRALKRTPVKLDLLLKSVDLSYESYLGYLKRKSNKASRSIEWEEWAINKIAKTLKTSYVIVMWRGRKLETLENAPNGAADTADGFTKVIREEVMKGAIPVIMHEPLDETNAYKVINNLFKAVADTPEKRQEAFVGYCGLDLLDLYQASYVALRGGTTHAKEHVGLDRIEGMPNSYLAPVNGIDGHGIFITLEGNLFCAENEEPELNLLYMFYALYVSWFYGWGFQIATTLHSAVNQHF